MHKEDLALNNLQWLICHATKPNHININKGSQDLSGSKVSKNNASERARWLKVSPQIMNFFCVIHSAEISDNIQYQCLFSFGERKDPIEY